MFGQRKAKGLNIIIVGCGDVGATIVEELSVENHDITVIDKNAELINELTNTYDIMGIVGNGASFAVLKEAGIVDADLIIAVTESDELNLLCCTVARRAGGECAAIARVRNPDYIGEIDYLREKLGLAMIINPDLESSREIARILYLPNALEVNSFAHGHADMIKFRIPDGNILDGMTVAAVGTKTENILICAVERKKQVYIPSGDFELKSGDKVSFVAPRKAAKLFFKMIGFKTAQVKNAIIAGGGNTAFYLSRQLIHMGIDVKIIEKSRSRCEELTTLIPKAVIINGNIVDKDMLLQEGLEATESFVTLSKSDEENILLTLYANQITNSNTKVVTRIHRESFIDVIDTLDLGSIVYPRYITTQSIVAYVRAKSASRGSNIETLSHMFDHRVEAIEFNVDTEYHGLTNIPISELKIKKETLISFINRHGKIIIPGGQDVIKPGDTVMVVTRKNGFVEIEDILE